MTTQTQSTVDKRIEEACGGGTPAFHLMQNLVQSEVRDRTAELQARVTELESTVTAQLARLKFFCEFYGEESTSEALVKLTRLERDAERWRALTDNRWRIIECFDEELQPAGVPGKPEVVRMKRFTGFGISVLPGQVFQTVEEAVDAAIEASRGI